MNKADLIEAVTADLGGSKADGARAIEAVLTSITKGLQRDGLVNIGGFGNFLKKHRPARMGRNPATKQPLEIKASTTVAFRPATQLKAQM